MKRFICILPEAKAQAANDWLALQYGEPARNTFSAGLNPTGDKSRPITHRICNWLVSETDYLLLAAEFGKAKYSATAIVEAPGNLDGENATRGKREITRANLKPQGDQE